MLDAMPSSNLKPEGDEEVELEADRVYRTTYMFSATMPPTVERLARKYLRRWGRRLGRVPADDAGYCHFRGPLHCGGLSEAIAGIQLLLASLQHHHARSAAADSPLPLAAPARPVVVNIGSAGRATDNVTQRIIMTKENEKPRWLQSELDVVEEKKAIVFVNTKRQCDNVFGLLENQGYRWALLLLGCCWGAAGCCWGAAGVLL